MTGGRTPQTTSEQRDSRVLVLSQRDLHRPVHHALQYEFEDLLTGFDDVDLLRPAPVGSPSGSRTARQVLNGGRRRVGARRRTPPWDRPSMRSTPVTAEHDLFFAVFNDAYQLSYLNRLPGWRERCRTAVCLLLEVWTDGVPADADYLSLLSQFDVVYAMTPAAGPALQALGSPAPRHLANGLDTTAFCPLPRPPRRVIDVYSFGRSSPHTHEQLLRLVEQQGLAYLYDTLSGSTASDHRAHRRLMASLMQRSRYFLAYRINDDPVRCARTGGEESLSTRYFEGAAGGAVMLGSRPPIPEFDECFDWPDAVIDLPWQGADAAMALDELSRQPERLARIRADGVRNSLLRHDWVHRWQRVLDDVGLGATRQMGERSARLEGLAESVLPERFLDHPGS